MDEVHGEELSLDVDQSELPQTDFIHLFFLAHKTIGYLFMKPITTASIIISLLHQTTDNNSINELGSLLFNPLLLNYSGKLRDFLINRAAIESGKTREAIQSAIETYESYLEDLKSVGTVPEMHPSQEQREAHIRHLQQVTSETFKEAMKKSIWNLLASKSVILYGKKSINYIRGPMDQAQRIEIPMSSHGEEFEMPRQDYIDPFGLDYMLRIFRAEKWKKV